MADKKGAGMLPVRGLHFAAPMKKDLARLLRFIREVLPKEQTNLLVIEFGYRFAFQTHPEVGDAAALGPSDVKQVAQACREAGVTLIPQIAMLGHQGHGADPGGLLRAYPQFDEASHAKPDQKDFYCRSWCPRHPELHKIVFALVDELCDACESTAFHAGMDEAFILADKRCPRCGGAATAEVFAEEVIRLRDHLTEKGRTMWMWGDRFLESARWETGKWSGSENETWPAIDSVPRDIVICDWHYTWVPRTAVHFVEKGFRTVMSPWQAAKIALGQLELMARLAHNPDPEFAKRSLGVLATTWCGFESFADAYDGRPVLNDPAVGAANCYKVLMAAFRGEIAYEGHLDAKPHHANV